MAAAQYQHTASAGGVVLRNFAGTIEVLLVERTRNVEPKWAPVLSQLPKGRVEAGESHEQTAIREVEEETGYRSRIIKKAGVASWCYERAGAWWREEVHYFLMTPQSAVPNDHDDEFDRVIWVVAADACKRVSYPEEKQMIVDVCAQQRQWVSALAQLD